MSNKSWIRLVAGLHKLWYPGIRDMSTWSKFGAHGEHGDVFLFSNLGALWLSEYLIRYSLHVCLREVKNNLFFLQTLLFTAYLVTVLKNLTYALVNTWSLVSSEWEHVKRKMHPCTLLTRFTHAVDMVYTVVSGWMGATFRLFWLQSICGANKSKIYLI